MMFIIIFSSKFVLPEGPKITVNYPGLDIPSTDFNMHFSSLTFFVLPSMTYLDDIVAFTLKFFHAISIGFLILYNEFLSMILSCSSLFTVFKMDYLLISSNYVSLY